MTNLAESVVILAHQGGWDELALLGGPVLVIVVLGYLARRGFGRDSSQDENSDPDRTSDTNAGDQ